MCCPACRGDMRRPPLHDLRVSFHRTWRPRAVAVALIMSQREGGDRADEALARLAGFRRELYFCFGMRRDVLFEVCGAVLCKQERVPMLAEVSLEAECRRGHGAVYDALNCGEVRFARLRRALASLPLREWEDGRIRLAVDVSNWLRPDAEASPERLFCHCYARGKGNAQMIPGRTPTSSRWSRAAPRGRCRWTRPGSAPPMTAPGSPPLRSATWSRGSSPRGGGSRVTRTCFRRRLRPDPAGLAAARPARGKCGQAAQRPGHALPGPAPARAAGNDGRAAAPA